MRIYGLARTAIACGCAGALLSFPGAALAGGAQPFVPGELLVRFAPRLDAAAVRSVLRPEDASVREKLDAVPGLRVLDLPAGTPVRDAARDYGRLPGVRYAEPNYRRDLQRVSRDPLFGRQWALRNTGQDVFGVRGLAGADEGAFGAWDRQVGSPGVNVAIVDTGLALGHPDLDGNLWANPGEIPGNGIDDDVNGYVDDFHGFDFLGRDPDPSDAGETDQGHGTHVAGIVGAEGANGVGIAGVDWDVSLMPLRAYGSVSEEIAAFAYARDNGARIVNYSAGSFVPSQAEQETIDASPGVLFVVAAGNDRTNNDASPIYPCAYPSENVICVGSSGQGDAMSRFSNIGPTSVDLVAPGENILSSWPAGAIADVLHEHFTRGSRRRWRRAGGGRSWLRTPAIDLRTWRSCVLSFAVTRRARSRQDRIAVETSRDGKRFRRVRRAKAAGKGTRIIELPRRFGRGRTSYVRFGLPRARGGRVTAIDDILISCEAMRDTWAYQDGTSFSAPQVAGAAGLVLAQHPGYSTAEVRAALLGGVDVLPDLYGKVATSGRLNVDAAVRP